MSSRPRSARSVLWHFGAVFCSLSISAGARPIRLPDLELLRKSADLIVVGRVQSVETGPKVYGEGEPGRYEIGKVEVQRVVSGSSVAGATLSIRYFRPASKESAAYERLRSEQLGLLFIRSVSVEEWGPADGSHFVLPARLETPPPSSDAVLSELVQVLCSPDVSTDEWIIALEAARNGNATAIVPALRIASQSSNSFIHWHSLIELLRRGDSESLAALQPVLMEQFPPESTVYLDAFAAAIGSAIISSDFVTGAVELFRSANTQIRRGAAELVRNAGGQLALANLPRLLSDPDQETRYLAVVGLGEAADDPDWAPSYEYFVENEERFISYWQEKFGTAP